MLLPFSLRRKKAFFTWQFEGARAPGHYGFVFEDVLDDRLARGLRARSAKTPFEHVETTEPFDVEHHILRATRGSRSAARPSGLGRSDACRIQPPARAH